MTSSRMTSSRIAELEAEIRRLRKLGRTKREPIAGIGGVLQIHREAHGMGVTEFAEKCGLPKGAISRLESGSLSNPTWNTIKALAKGLKIKPSQLVAGFEAAPKKPQPPARKD